jgi:hypothetical protein
MKNKSKFDIDPLKSFYDLPQLKYGVLVISFFSLISTTIIWIIDSPDLLVSSEGFNNLFEIYKAPLGILAMVIPYIAFLATTHRSVQAKEQIEATNKQISIIMNQNIFANYYKHVDEFGKYLESLNLIGKNIIKSKNTLYNILYPNSKKGDYSFEPHIKNSLSSLNESFGELFNNLGSGFNFDQNLLKENSENIDGVFHTLNLNHSRNGVRINIGGEMYVFEELTLQGFISTLKSKSSDLLKVINFEPYSTDTHYILMISSINLDCIPIINIHNIDKEIITVPKIELEII